MAEPRFALSLARTEDDLASAQRLRYAVFVEEMGADGPHVDHAAHREADGFDAHCDHLILRDVDREDGDRVVGVCRMLRGARRDAAGGFYSETEFDLAALRASGRRIMELGRSCLHRDYRGGLAQHHLLTGLAAYVERHGIEILFGVASFHGTRVAALAPSLSVLHHRHLAPPGLRPRARPPAAMPLDMVPYAGVDRISAMREMPPLLKAYLRLGAGVGEGAFVDRAFNTTDVCVVCDTRALTASQRQRYAARRT